MASELPVSLPLSQGDAPQVTVSERLHTYISFHRGDEWGLLSQLVSTAEQNVVKTLSYTEKFDRF